MRQARFEQCCASFKKIVDGYFENMPFKRAVARCKQCMYTYVYLTPDARPLLSSDTMNLIISKTSTMEITQALSNTNMDVDNNMNTDAANDVHHFV